MTPSFQGSQLWTHALNAGHENLQRRYVLKRQRKEFYTGDQTNIEYKTRSCVETRPGLVSKCAWKTKGPRGAQGPSIMRPRVHGRMATTSNLFSFQPVIKTKPHRNEEPKRTKPCHHMQMATVQIVRPQRGTKLPSCVHKRTPTIGNHQPLGKMKDTNE